MMFTSNLYASITHLELATIQWAILQSASMRDLPSVTHLLLDMRTAPTADLGAAIGDLIPSLPKTLQLLILMLTHHSVAHPNFFDLFYGVMDVRIVPCKHREGYLYPEAEGLMVADVYGAGFLEWCGRVQEEHTYWARGMEIVERRKNEQFTISPT